MKHTPGHTPGPWTIHKEDDRTVTSGDGPVAKTFVGNSARANAVLIAAAPTLLEACRELELRTRHLLAGKLVAFPAGLLPQVRAAIALATGAGGEK